MYSNILNNWFYGEDVQVDDMKLLTKSFLQLCFAANGGNVMATGLTPTITGNNIVTTKGFVYFGETSDAIFIERTGTNQLISFVDPTSVPLIANGYLYVKPIITYDVNNRTSTVSGVVYTSTNAADEGINLATITNSVITQVNSINPLGATQLQRGIIQLATQAEVNAGTITNKAIAPSTFAASTQLAAKAPLVSPALTGTPTAPTAALGDNTTQLATTAFVKNQGFQPNLGFTPVQQGGGTGQQANKLYMGWGTNSRIKVQVDTTDQGNLVTDSYLNNGTLPASFTGALSLVGSGSMYVAGTGDVSGYGFVASTPNGVYAPNGNSQLGALTMQQRSVANLGISYPNIPGATSYTMGFGWDGSHVRCMVDNNTGVVPVLANFGGNPIQASNYQAAYDTTINVGVSFTAPCRGILLAIGNTNYGSLAPSANTSTLFINGTAFVAQVSIMTRALVATTTCEAGPVSANNVASATGIYFTAYVTLVFIPYL